MREAVVAVGVATLWTAPEAPRPVDAPALGTPAHPRHWLNAMTSGDRAGLNGRTLTQIPLGEAVLVEEEREGWSRVLVPSQASELDERGYPGWLPSAQLTGASAVPGDAYIVDATSTALRDEPSGDVALPAVVLGTRLVAAGPVVRGWVPVHVPGQAEPLFARLRDLRAAAAGAGTPLAVAERLLDVPYIWGGVSAYGIDCSGLVHLAYARTGQQVPRDAAEQQAAATPVALGTEQPGDLYFFARPGQPVHHVGFVLGERRMLHACYTGGKVVAEDLTPERSATLVSAGRL
ncbi:C40 family peptidase [Longispora albida]|uniref:C40 family peptidase n=1 Tax=Longispora albida TaxID=203523 RepID=UPI00035DD304|nr:C40 family peptidase [Longispora albida]